MAKKFKLETEKKPELIITGYAIPDLSPQQAEQEMLLCAMPIFSTEKKDYKKEISFKTLSEAKAAILKRYGRAQ